MIGAPSAWPPAAVRGVYAVPTALLPRGPQVRHADGALAGAVLAKGRVVARVLVSVLDADEEPPDTATEGLDNVPQVHGVPQGLDADEAPRAGDVLVLPGLLAIVVWVRYGVECRLGGVEVGPVGESPEVEDGEDGHLEAEQERGDADFKVRVGEHLVGVDDVEGRRADTDGGGLPEGEEDDELDGEDLEEGGVLG